MRFLSWDFFIFFKKFVSFSGRGALHRLSFTALVAFLPILSEMFQKRFLKIIFAMKFHHPLEGGLQWWFAAKIYFYVSTSTFQQVQSTFIWFHFGCHNSYIFSVSPMGLVSKNALQNQIVLSITCYVSTWLSNEISDVLSELTF